MSAEIASLGKVFIVMGSASDKEKVLPAIEYLKDNFPEITVEARILSAHRTPVPLIDAVRNANADVYIACAGMAAHLAGFVAAFVPDAPVIGVPLSSSKSPNNEASLLATVEMPPGVPVATVALDGAKNAAILAVQILATKNRFLKQRLARLREEAAADVLKMDEAFEQEVKDT